MTLRCSGALWQVPGGRSRARRGRFRLADLRSPVYAVSGIPGGVLPSSRENILRSIGPRGQEVLLRKPRTVSHGTVWFPTLLRL